MKKILFLSILCFFAAFSYCQTKAVPRIENDTLYTTSGYKISIGQEIKIGVGTKDNGDFKFITAARSLLAMPNQRSPSLRSSANGHTATVKKIKAEGNSKNGYVYYIIIGVGEPINYACDIESAIAAGEIVVPEQYKLKAKATATTQPFSVADELAKLKKLYDDSVITKEEYEAQKKKLLDGN
jgi:hypothetical protein